MTTETDSLHRSLGEAERYVKELEAQVRELMAALKPFADEFEQYHHQRPIEGDAVRVRMTGVGPYFTIGDLRRAHAAITTISPST